MKVRNFESGRYHARGNGSGDVWIVLEDLFERHVEHRCDPERHLQGGRVFPVLDGIHRLARTPTWSASSCWVISS